MIDLHFHSTFSDGSLTPEQLVKEAVEAGLTAISLTDHDCTDGTETFLEACHKHMIRGISGIEISADIKHGTLHMLGYFVNYKDSDLQAKLKQIRDGREIRNKEILEKLHSIGMDLEWDEVKKHAGEDVVGRPHFALALMARGHVASGEEAFEKYLGKGRPAYADRFRFSPEDSIKMIYKAGGIPVLAHPSTLGLKEAELVKYVTELRGMGLQGIEVYYSEHNTMQMKEYHAIARGLDLVVTGGSDFHGSLNPAIHLGRGFGNLNVPDELVNAMMERINRQS